ncbi:MAG: hypothetical protein ACD_76C00107G0004 [uncultured bacterium]|nr:MAG: hypothetical protein ACD_76C00107G0004 [uncultured bacterium]HBD05556.1 ATP synthase F1 subunit delta [Candidatus Uhrbacteria bacterium]
MKLKTKQTARLLYELTNNKTENEIDNAMQAFVEYLASEQMLSSWGEIILMFDEMWKKEHGAAVIEVMSSEPLSQKLAKQIQSIAPSATLYQKVDKSLIGGVSIRIDDRIYDGTARSQLNLLQESMS